MKSIQLKRKELQNYKFDVDISAHVADVSDRMRKIEIVVVKGQICHMTTRYIIKKKQASLLNILKQEF